MPLGLFSRSPSLPVRVEPFFGYRNEARLFLNARAIRSAEPVFTKRSFWRDFATMVGQYLSKEVPDLPVELHYPLDDGRKVHSKVVTGPEGYARFEVDIAPDAPRPERTRWEKASVRWRCEEGTICEAPAYILTPGTQTQTGVISDIDDTILETGITGNLRMIARNWKRVMATMPSERIVVPGARSFYAAIGGKDTRPSDTNDASQAIDALEPQARVRPVFYVSSSPWNLFSYLVTFKRERNLPLGPIMLRDWGFNRKTLGKEGHGSHKMRSIENILAAFPHLRFALIGDDSQKDLAAFGAIAQAHPGRIAAVFIREVSGEPLNDEELHARDIIEKAGVPLWTGSDYTAAKAFLRSAGLELEGGVKKLVQTASKGEA